MNAQGTADLVGWLGVAMLISSVTGLILWWPRGAFAAIVQGLRWGRSASVFSNLHHMAGFWICVPLAVLSLSGAWIAFPQAMHALTAPLGGNAEASRSRDRRDNPEGERGSDPRPASSRAIPMRRKMRANDALATAVQAVRFARRAAGPADPAHPGRQARLAHPAQGPGLGR